MSSVHSHQSAPPSPSPPTALHAFVDESMRRVDEETKYYLMAAAVVMTLTESPQCRSSNFPTLWR